MTVEAPPRIPEQALVEETAPELLPDYLESDEDPAVVPPISPRDALTIGAAAFLSSAGAGWMCSSIFTGALPHVIAVLGALIGAGGVALSYRSSRPAFVQLMLFPLTFVIGAILLAPYTGRGESLPGLIREAVRLGGLQFAPVQFRPGWHFLLLLLTVMIAGAAGAIATSRGQARIATFIPLPLLFAAALVQPSHGGFVSTGIGLGFVVASLAVSYGAELSHQESTSGRFEARRLLRAATVMTGLGIVLALVAQAGFLFPPETPSHALPPRHPQLPPPVPDRLLFTVSAPTPVPVRVGVLDGYADNGWETPPYDPTTLRRVRSGTVPADKGVPVAPPVASLSSKGTMAVTFRIANLTGAVLPDAAEPESFDPGSTHLDYDPRTQVLQTTASTLSGLTYSEVVATPPSAKQMQTATDAPAALSEFTLAPPAPTAVAALLAKAPTNGFDRVQYLRTALYKAVIAKGAGVPANVSPADVAGMLAGKTATPYQIIAAEALLARWAGLPARIGYGYYDTTPTKPGRFDINPADGASWLEVYFGGIGWVPLIGQPLHAEASLSKQKPKSKIEPSRQLALVVYVPGQTRDAQQIYTLVRWWVSVLLPYLAGLALAWTFWPGLLKAARRRRRLRWAGQDPGARILVAYAGLRDVASDLRIGVDGALPLAFLEHVAPDEEHEELAWLVTRSLWGDLRRDVRPEDADAAERMASSVSRRLAMAQSATNRIVAFAARTSLRDPYTWDIPALWRRPRPAHSDRRTRLARLATVSPALGIVLVLVGLAALVSNSSSGPAPALPVGLPPRVAPATVVVGPSTFTLRQEPKAEAAYAKAGSSSLVAEGRVYTVRLNTAVQASLQVGAFKATVDARRREVLDGILKSLGLGGLQRTSLPNGGTVCKGTLPSQTVLVYVPPSGRYFVLLVAQESFADTAAVFDDIIAYQGGGS